MFCDIFFFSIAVRLTWLNKLFGSPCRDQGARPQHLLPRKKGSDKNHFGNLFDLLQGQGGPIGGEYDYPEYPIYERSDTVDYTGGFLDEYPASLLQGSHQRGPQRSAQEDHQGYQKVGFGQKDPTTRRFLRRFGNLSPEKADEVLDEAAV